LFLHFARHVSRVALFSSILGKKKSKKSAAAKRVSSRAATGIWRTQLTAYAVVELRLAWQRGRAHLVLDLACHALRVALVCFFLSSFFFQETRHSKQRSLIHASRDFVHTAFAGKWEF
jgi:hypothetical protein